MLTSTCFNHNLFKHLGRSSASFVPAHDTLSVLVKLAGLEDKKACCRDGGMEACWSQASS